ncbi:SSD domain-containing protein [Meloidogyne graminicola]|uniref:SSD domain-containing protein n=1 Tax=Meloidogyne graminicola TaxID=189291 RepID=A0A8S9ZJL3_9BILA|nr:SSD domain-containing protein [Meloidogyne graminicola]
MRHPTLLFEKGFYLLGYQIGKNYLKIILIIIIITLIASIGLLRFEEINNVRTEYSPSNAQSKNEYKVAKYFLKQFIFFYVNGTLDPCYIMSRARDGEIFYIYVEKNGHFYNYRNICEPYCELNTAFLAFLKVYDKQQPLTYTYPAVELFGTRAFIGNNIYGVSLKNLTGIENNNNNERTELTTKEEQAFLLAIQKINGNKKIETIKLLETFTTAVMPFFWLLIMKTKIYLLNGKMTGMTSDYLVTQEVRRMGAETAPLLATSVVFMIIFVVSTSFRAKKEENRFIECFIGCLVPLFAMSTAIGLMAATGYKFQSIIVAALFLVLSVGVDDIFILMRAWHRTNKFFKQNINFDNQNKLAKRMALCLEDAVHLQMLFRLLLGHFLIHQQLELSLHLQLRKVDLNLQFLFSQCMYKKHVGYINLITILQFVIKKIQTQINNFYSTVASIAIKSHYNLIKFWAWAVTQWITRIILALFMFCYFFLCWFGIRKLQSNISIDKMALPNSYLHDFQMQFEMALRNMQPITIFVLNPGDMRDLQQLSRIKQLVWDFEHALNSYGQESTFFWLQQYEDFLRFYSNGNENFDDHEFIFLFKFKKKIDPLDEYTSPRFTYTEIPSFFKSAAYFYLSSFVHYNETACNLNKPECINSFFFVTNFHKVIKYHELVPTVTEWRRIAAHYSDMQVFAYSDHTPFVDQTISIDQTILGSVAAALFCTCIVCMLFIPYFLSVIAAVFSVFSISWGIFGILSMWNIDLDPLSMASLLMAIGISVDFTAHISYHYYKAPEENPRLRMQQALTVIGYPMVQVGISTIVALLPLLFKQSYLAMTIIVVVSLGMFHGLVLLPAVLTALPLTKQKNKNINKNSIIERNSVLFTINTKLEEKQMNERNSHLFSQNRQWRESGCSSKSQSNFSSGSSSDAGLGSSGGESSKASSRLEGIEERRKRRCKNKVLDFYNIENITCSTNTTEYLNKSKMINKI